jgi:hypothetical protein
MRAPCLTHHRPALLCGQRVRSGTAGPADHATLAYHVLLVRLLSISTEGKNGVAETTCQNLLTTEDVLAHMKVRGPSTPPAPFPCAAPAWHLRHRSPGPGPLSLFLSRFSRARAPTSPPTVTDGNPASSHCSGHSRDALTLPSFAFAAKL